MSDIFDKRCALINKKGVCYQCTELNAFFNPKQKAQEVLLLGNENQDKYQLLKLRTLLVKGIDPLQNEGSAIQDDIMQVLRTAIVEK